mmetsp:Transcript_24164/g.76304  ORF Transcript_24164/g.76304 Transcript_24164/m.76304 type:complete len:244 (+) Transcript_24164:461-1192(+)
MRASFSMCLSAFSAVSWAWRFILLARSTISRDSQAARAKASARWRTSSAIFLTMTSPLRADSREALMAPSSASCKLRSPTLRRCFMASSALRSQTVCASLQSLRADSTWPRALCCFSTMASASAAAACCVAPSSSAKRFRLCSRPSILCSASSASSLSCVVFAGAAKTTGVAARLSASMRTGVAAPFGVPSSAFVSWSASALCSDFSGSAFASRSASVLCSDFLGSAFTSALCSDFSGWAFAS